MTVIALFYDHGLAASDLLISRNDSGDYENIPTLGDTLKIREGIDISIVGLARKIFYINSNNEKASILWAGKVSDVKRLFISIKKQVSDTADSLLTIIETCVYYQEQEGYGDFELIAFIDNKIWSRSSNSEGIKIPYFGEVYSAGSGASTLKDILFKRGSHFTKWCKDNKDEKAHRIYNSVTSMLLEEDTRTTLKTIKNGVGGYYESFYFSSPGVLSPIEDVMTAFIKLKSDGVELRRLFFHCYEENLMIIGSITGLPLALRYGESVKVANKSIAIYKAYGFNCSNEQFEDNTTKEEYLLKKMSLPESYSLTFYSQDNNRELKRFFMHRESDTEFPIKIAIAGNGDIILQAGKEITNYYRTRFKETMNEIIEIS